MENKPQLLKKNSWHTRIVQFVFNLNSENFNYLCPYFWVVIAALILLPFVAIWRIWYNTLYYGLFIYKLDKYCKILKEKKYEERLRKRKKENETEDILIDETLKKLTKFELAFLYITSIKVYNTIYLKTNPKGNSLNKIEYISNNEILNYITSAEIDNLSDDVCNLIGNYEKAYNKRKIIKIGKFIKISLSIIGVLLINFIIYYSLSSLISAIILDSYRNNTIIILFLVCMIFLNLLFFKFFRRILKYVFWDYSLKYIFKGMTYVFSKIFKNFYNILKNTFSDLCPPIEWENKK